MTTKMMMLALVLLAMLTSCGAKKEVASEVAVATAEDVAVHCDDDAATTLAMCLDTSRMTESVAVFTEIDLDTGVTTPVTILRSDGDLMIDGRVRQVRQIVIARTAEQRGASAIRDSVARRTKIDSTSRTSMTSKETGTSSKSRGSVAIAIYVAIGLCASAFLLWFIVNKDDT